MKVSIGSQIIKGPWGGGNLFVANLSKYLKNLGHEVIYNLSEPDIDLIVLTDPRSRKDSTSTFNHIEIEKYKNYVKRDVVVVQRINECDERKGTENINDFYLEVSKSADHVTFVSTWLEKIYLNLGMSKNKTSVILAGADSDIFNNSNLSSHKDDGKMSIVTHHWSSHENKGFKIYKLINDLVGRKEWAEKLEFTYIGNMSDEYRLTNTNLVNPLAGLELAAEIKKHQIYVTASINEPSGNHHIEAAQCGLPIIYLESGGIPEYCEGYGLSFNHNFEEQLIKMIENYEHFQNKMKNYPRTSETMCREYYDLFNSLIAKKKTPPDKINLVRYPFLLKHKFYRVFRDKLYFNTKNYLIYNLRKFLKKNG